MKDKIKNIKQQFKNESGLVIIEAAIVFPVMFFVLFFILYIGNLYYEQARVDDIVATYAVKGAQYSADPSQKAMEEKEEVPTEVNGQHLEPYRYIFGGIGDGGSIGTIEDEISAQVKKEIAESKLVFFGNFQAKYTGTDNKNKVAEFHSYVLYSQFVVQVNYELRFPIRFIFVEDPVVAKFSSRSEVTVSDAPEFIRNVDMAIDLLDGTKGGDYIKNLFDKINAFVGKFS